MNVAFIGLGNMGEPMCHNVLKAGHTLSIYNRTESRTGALRQVDAAVAKSTREAARDAEVVCTCVSTPDVVHALILGEDAALAGAQDGAVFIDFSTIDPATSRDVAQVCAEEGIPVLDAPVSGGVSGVAAGMLAVIVGERLGGVV